jgi:hypothetical protein
MNSRPKDIFIVTYRSWTQYGRIVKNDNEPTNNSTPAEISSGSTQDRAETQSLSLQLRRTAPAAKTAFPEMKLHHAFAGTTAVSMTGRNNLLSPAPTANRKTNSADFSGGTCLHLNHWPPLHR